MKWELAIIAATVLAVAAISRRMTGTSVTPAIVFVAVGVLVGPLVIDGVAASPTGEGVRTLAGAALAIVLAILLAPTDAALGEAVVSEPRLPSRIRQGLNVESGLNDGICVPLLLIALAAANVEAMSATTQHAIRIVADQIGNRIAGGLAAGLAAAGVVAIADRPDLITGSWLQIIPLTGAGLGRPGVRLPSPRP